MLVGAAVCQYDINTPETHRLCFTKKVELKKWAQGISGASTGIDWGIIPETKTLFQSRL